MATTSVETATHLLDALESVGVRHALLHNEGDIARGEVTSDLDLVVDRPGADVIRALQDKLRAARLSVIAQFPYDLGAASYFICNETAEEAVQLDLMHDPRARGRLGVRSDQLLAGARRGARFHRLSDVDELLYLLVKRSMKRDYPRVDALREQACARGTTEVLARADVVMGTRARSCVRVLLEGSCPDRRASRGRGYGARSAFRLGTRVIRPVGFWADLYGAPGTEAPEAVAERFALMLPSAVFLNRPDRASLQGVWWLSAVVPTRLRPALVVSGGARKPHPAADLTLPAEGLTVDAACRAVVRAMADRLDRQLWARP